MHAHTSTLPDRGLQPACAMSIMLSLREQMPCHKRRDYRAYFKRGSPTRIASIMMERSVPSAPPGKKDLTDFSNEMLIERL